MSTETILRHLLTEIERLKLSMQQITNAVTPDELANLQKWKQTMEGAGYTIDNVTADSEIMRQWTKINTLRQVGINKVASIDVGIGIDSVLINTKTLDKIRGLIDNCYTNTFSVGEKQYGINIDNPSWIGGWLQLPLTDGKYSYELDSSSWTIEVNSTTKQTIITFLTNQIAVDWDIVEGYDIKPSKLGITYNGKSKQSKIYTITVRDTYELKLLLEYEGYVEPMLFPDEISTIFVSYLSADQIEREFLRNYEAISIMDIYAQLNIVQSQVGETIQKSDIGGSNASAGIVALNQVGELKKIVPLQYTTTYSIAAQTLQINKITGQKLGVTPYQYSEIEKERIYSWRILTGKLKDDDGIGVYAVPIVGEIPEYMTGNGIIHPLISTTPENYQIGMEPYMLINLPTPLGQWDEGTSIYKLNVELADTKFKVVASNEGGTYDLSGYLEMEVTTISEIRTEVKCNGEYLWFQVGKLENDLTKFTLVNSYDNFTPMIKLPVDHKSDDPINIDQTVKIIGIGKIKVVILNDRLQLTGASFNIPRLGTVKLGDREIELVNVEFKLQSILLENNTETVAYVGTYDGITLTEDSPLNFTRRFIYNPVVTEGNNTRYVIYRHSKYTEFKFADATILETSQGPKIITKPFVRTAVVQLPREAFNLWYRDIKYFYISQNQFTVPIAKTNTQNYVRAAGYVVSVESSGGNLRIRPASYGYFEVGGEKCYIWSRGDFNRIGVSSFPDEDWVALAMTTNTFTGKAVKLGKLLTSNTPSYKTTASNDFHSSYGYVLGPQNVKWEGRDSMGVYMTQENGYDQSFKWNSGFESGTRYQVSGPKGATVTYKILPITGYVPPEFLLNSKTPQIILETTVQIASIESGTSTGEIWLPEGSNNLTYISEYLISLGATITSVATLMTEFNNRLNTLTERVNLMDSILESLIKQINKSTSTLGVIGNIASLIGGSLANFLPIVGTAITLLGDILTTIDNITDGDWLVGGLSLMVAISLFGYTNHKYIQKLKRRRMVNSVTDKTEINLSKDIQSIIRNRMGTMAQPGKIVNGVIISPRVTSTDLSLSEKSLTMTSRQSMSFTGGEELKLNLNEAINQGLIDATGLPSYKAVQLQTVLGVTITSTDARRRQRLSGRANQVVKTNLTLIGYGMSGNKIEVIDDFLNILKIGYSSNEDQIYRHFVISSLAAIEDNVVSKVLDTDGIFNAMSLMEPITVSDNTTNSRTKRDKLHNLSSTNQRLGGLNGDQTNYARMDKILPIVSATSESVLELLA